MNVFIIAAGRRTSLVRAFAADIHERGGFLYAGDVDGLAPALEFADVAIQTLRTDEAGYLDHLLETVSKHEIALIIPTIDADLPILAAAATDFLERGCRVAASTPDFVSTTLDKHRTGIAFGGAGIHVPWTWLPRLGTMDLLPADLFVKPRSGSASQDTFRITQRDLPPVLALQTDPLVQELLTGPEITIDALLDLSGVPIHYVPRLRIRTLAGESVQGVTIAHDPAIEDWIQRLLQICSILGAAGPLTIQAFLTPSGPVLSEINPRFGGGFPLAMKAGAAYPAWLLDMAAGQTICPRLGDYEAGLYMTRYHVEHFTRQPRW